MKIKTDIRRLCDDLSEEFYEDLDVASPAEAEGETGMETEGAARETMSAGADRSPDPERIKEIALRKIREEGVGKEKEIKKPMKRISHKILIAAALIAVLTTTAFAAGGLDFFRSFFGDSVDQAGDGIQKVEASAESDDFTMTAEQIISDGTNTKIIVGLQPKTKQAEKWLGDSKTNMDIAAESADFTDEGMSITGSEALPQFSTKEKAYFCVSYVSDQDYTGKPVTVTFRSVNNDSGTIFEPGLSLVIDNPTSMKTKKLIEFAKEDGEVSNTQPVSLVVNAISAVLTLQEPVGSTDTPTLDVTLVMKDGTKENIFEAGWVEEGATGGGGVALGEPEELPLASGNSYKRNLETGQIVQTSSFSRIIDVDSVDYAIVGGERYDFQ